jgi:hypothetical protein
VNALARGAAALLCGAWLSCVESGGPADLSGTWAGYVSDPSGSPASLTPTVLDLSQSGQRVVGTMGGLRLVGEVAHHSLSFTLDAGEACGVTASGTGLLERLPDRDRLSLSFSGSGICGSIPPSTARFERLTWCPAPRVECAPDYVNDLSPSCVDLKHDPEHCGACGVRCHGSCVEGECDLAECGGPVPLELPRSASTGARLWALVLGDVDGDGHPDAILSGFRLEAGDSVILLLAGDGQGGFTARSTTAVSSLFSGDSLWPPSALAVGDLDADGRADLAAYVGARPYPDNLTTEGAILTLLGNGDGTFRAGERFPTGRDSSLMYLGVRVLAVADLNHDGHADLAARSGSAPAVQVRLGRGDGTLGPPAEHAVPYPVDAIAAADLDGDGAVDLAVALNGDPIFAGVPPAVAVLLGNGDGTFRAPVESAGMPYPQDIAAADVDEDGRMDLAVIGWWSWASHAIPNVSVLLGNGDGTFQAPLPVEQEPWSFTWSLAVSDLDADGHLDLAVGDDERGLELFLGRGDGTFAPFEHPVAGGAGLVAAADLDGDGRVDLVAGDPGGREDVAVLRACAP